MTGIDGGTLREWRESRRWDVPAMARELRRAAGSDPVAAHDALVQMIWRWERAGMNIVRARSTRYELLYRAVFRATGEQLRSGPPPLDGESSAGTAGPDSGTAGLPGSPPYVLGDDARAHMQRALADARRYLDHGAVLLFRRQLELGKAEDGETGPGRALPRVLGVAAAIAEHARDARPAVRRGLLALGAETAEFAGWLYRDLRDPGQAGYWYDRAMELAQLAPDLPMQGYVLLRKSQMAFDLEDAYRVDAFAAVADEGDWQFSPVMRAEAAQQRALGMAMTGALARDVERQMGTASDIIAASGDSGAEKMLRLRQAACWTEAGRPGRAAAQFADIIGSGMLSKRDTAFFRARYSVALALSGEPDRAAEVGLLAAQTAQSTLSRRTVRVLADTVGALDRWKTRPGPRELRETVTALGSAPSH